MKGIKIMDKKKTESNEMNKLSNEINQTENPGKISEKFQEMLTDCNGNYMIIEMEQK